jgi:hypothetical protein
MGQRDTTRRRFTLSDTAILVASMGVGLWLGRSYLLNERIVFDSTGLGRSWWSWAATAWMVLMPVQLGLLGLSLIPPRRPLRRLARQPGFLGGVAVASAAATSVVQAAANFNQSMGRGANPFETWLHNNMIAISAPYRLAPVILLAWMIVALQRGCRRSHDWVETSARLLGGVWIIAWCTYMSINILK